ncbi:MAG: ribosome-associated translation inhibitor RaiA [Pseudomonadales bacterium]|nr:ribosome-associated translation inhibitor RaiA [Pseudomonadales bacterium]
MQINISGHHVEVTDSLRDYVSEKMQKLERHTDDITSIQATLIVEKNRQKAEARIHVKGADLFANAESEDMYAAIDMLTDKLDRQVVKHKEKMKSW